MDAISLIISIVIPILVMICTLCSQKKSAERERKLNEEQFKETLMVNDKCHNESMQLQKDNNRVSQLPFLFLNQDFIIGNREGRFIFPLEITNLGNGVALDIKVKYKTENHRLPYVYKEQLYQREEYYRYTGFLFTNVLPVNSKASFELLLDIYENGKEVLQKDKIMSGTVCFSITYKDTYYNEYEQEYMFQYASGIGVGRVETYLPRLIKENDVL